MASRSRKYFQEPQQAEDSVLLAEDCAPLLENMDAPPEEGSVLGNVDSWIRKLETKWTAALDGGRGDPALVKDTFRRHITSCPFPSLDEDDVIKDRIIICPPPHSSASEQGCDYALDLDMVDLEDERAEENLDGGARRVSSYTDACKTVSKTPLPNVVDALLKGKAEELMDKVITPGQLTVARCSLACGGLVALSPFLGELMGLTTLNLAGNMIQDKGITAFARSLHRCRSLTSLNIDDNKIGPYGSVALAEQLKGKWCKITTFSVRKNKLSDMAVSALVEALVTGQKIERLILAYNDTGHMSCLKLADLLLKCRTLEYLDCHWGHMRGEGAVVFASALKSAEKLTHLDLGWNGFGDVMASNKLADFLRMPTCKLVHLDLSHNRMVESSAGLITEALQVNKSLKTLNLDSNPIGKIGRRRILSVTISNNTRVNAEEVDTNGTCHVSLTDTDFALVNPNSFDPSEPAGEYLFDMTDPYSRFVLRDLLKLEAIGKGQFQRQTVYLDGKYFKLKKLESLEDDCGLPEAGEMSFRFVSTRQPPKFDDVLEDHIFQAILEHFSDNSKPIMDEKRMGKLEFLKALISADSVFSYEQATELIVHVPHGEDRVQFVAALYHKLNRPWAPKKLAQDFLDEQERKMLMKLLGPTAFAFTPKNPSGHHTLDLSSQKEREVAVKLLDARNLQEEISRPLALKFNKHKGGPRDLIGHCWLNAAVNTHNATEKFHEDFSARSTQLPQRGVLELDFVSLVKPQDLEKLGETIDVITDENWASFLKDILQEGVKLIEIVTEFRELSNTHVFKCSHVRQMLRLIDELDFKYSEAAASKAEAVILSRTPSAASVCSRTPNTERKGGMVDRNGRNEGQEVELEGVDVIRPRTGIQEQTVASQVPPRTAPARLAREKIETMNLKIVDLANLSFMNEEAKLFVDGFLRPSRVRQMPLETSKLRVEICVTAYARTLDYLGFYGIHGLFKCCLSRPERGMLKQRIGTLNMFHPAMAVDYYELDLSEKSDRWIMQELVHLSVEEPGQNCVNETYNDIDFPIPATWVTDVPRKDVFTCFYCREQVTINSICANANTNHPGSVSTDVVVPALTSWTRGAKCWQIKQKMAEKYASAWSCFSAIDMDGSGTVERGELARGLFMLGVWLRPTELATLFESVDKDNGGDVDFSEFEYFWNTW